MSSYYNLGNTLYRTGQTTLEKEPQATIKSWEDAIKAYEDSLALNPDDEDALFNKELVTRKLEELKKQQEQNEDKQEDKDIAAKIGVFFPNQKDRGTHINISGGGVVKTAPNKEAAIQFLEYLASKEAQQTFAASNNEYPAVGGVTVDSVLASYGKFKEDSLNAAIYGRKNQEALMIMDRAGWK